MYCHAMKQAGADITPINTFLNEIQHLNVSDALNKSDAPDHSKIFVNKTFEILEDPMENRVSSVASLMGLKKVGMIFAHPPREKGYQFSGYEILTAAELQLECAQGNHLHQLKYL